MTNMKKIQPTISEITHDEHVTRQLDIHIGNLIKRLRIKSGVTQASLSKGTGVSLAQIQKYENATNRVSASRLYWFARTLKTSPNYFFDSFVSLNQKLTGLSDNPQEAFVHDNDAVKARADIETQEILDAYFKIKDAEKRTWFLRLMQQEASQE